MVIVQENTFVWNTGGLRADLGLVRSGGWAELDDEAQKEYRRRGGPVNAISSHVAAYTRHSV